MLKLGGILLKNIISKSKIPQRSLSIDQNVIFRQLFDNDTKTYTYILGDRQSKDAIVIDPVFELVERDIKTMEELDVKVKYLINTHVHADHITGSGRMKKLLNKQDKQCESVISKKSGAIADKFVDENDTLDFGSMSLRVLATPGHTAGCISLEWHVNNKIEAVFTGDAVLIRGCGRTDFQQGDAGLLYDGVHKKILSLSDDVSIFPAHDYVGQSESSVGEEKKFNKRFTLNRDDFIKFMEELSLPYPRYIDKSLPANLVCGIQDSHGMFIKLSKN
ncbi:hypothetical protein SNEBB_009924 [Seison nebaliae]|nr:hypothetical protein SNEBB_009924 [Seison nebaliae]